MLAVIVIALNSVQLFSLINTAVFFLILCLADISLFKENPIKIAGVELTYFVVIFLSETIIQTIAGQFSGMSAADVSTNFSEVRIISGMFSTVLLVVVCIGVNKLLNKNKVFI